MTTIDRSELSRMALIDAASKLFVHKSYREVSTRELADEARVNQALIQYHFGSKAGLFAAAVDHLMQESKQHPAFVLLKDKAESQFDATVKICRFILEYLDHLLRSKKQCGFSLLIREVFSGLRDNTELFDLLVKSFVDKYGRPLKSDIGDLLAKINVRLSQEELDHLVVAIVSQCSFYATHQPFIEALDGVSLSENLKVLEAAAKHIALFSLIVLGIERNEFDEAFTQACREYNERLSKSLSN